MAYLGTDRGKLKRRFFLPIPNREQCVAIVGTEMTDEVYRGIRGSCSYTILMGIWSLYLGYNQLLEGGRYRMLDGSGESINDSSIVLQARWVATKVGSDGIMTNTLYPDFQVLCRKGEYDYVTQDNKR
jgi:hypothetical protein